MTESNKRLSNRIVLHILSLQLVSQFVIAALDKQLHLKAGMGGMWYVPFTTPRRIQASGVYMHMWNDHTYSF